MSDRLDKPRELSFSADASEIWGDTIADLEALDALFSPHSFAQLQKDPELCRLVFEQAQPFILKCKAALRKFFMTSVFGRENPDKFRNPKTDGIKEFMRALKSLTHVYPAYARSDIPFIQALYINIIFYGVVSELFSRFMNHQADKRVERAFGAFHLGEIVQGMGPNDTNRTSSLLRELPSTRAFFNSHDLALGPVDHLSLPELTAINERLFAAINKHREYDVPLSVSHEEDICHVPVCLVAEQPRLPSAEFGMYDADITMYDASFEDSLTKRGVLDRLRTHPEPSSMSGARVLIHGESVQLLVDRFKGELATTTLSAEALKILLGEKKYETLRAYILFRYAQLACDDRTFVREFKDFITLIAPPPHVFPGRRGGAPDIPPPPPPPDPPPWRGKLPLRFFPRAARRYLRGSSPATNGDPSPTGRTLRGRRTEPHRHLLPAGFKPTKKAFEKARGEAADLLSNFETVYEILDQTFRFTDPDLQKRFAIGEFIFTHDDVTKEAAARGVTLETLFSTHEEVIRERQFTYMPGHEFGDVTRAVRARFRYGLMSAATPAPTPASRPEPAAVDSSGDTSLDR